MSSKASKACNTAKERKRARISSKVCHRAKQRMQHTKGERGRARARARALSSYARALSLLDVVHALLSPMPYITSFSCQDILKFKKPLTLTIPAIPNTIFFSPSFFSPLKKPLTQTIPAIPGHYFFPPSIFLSPSNALLRFRLYSKLYFPTKKKRFFCERYISLFGKYLLIH